MILQLFEKVRTMFPNVQKKLHPVEGDCSLPLLGLKPEDRKVLVEEVNLIFHMAATVRFDETLRQATNINVRGTRDVIELAKQVTNIKVMYNEVSFQVDYMCSAFLQLFPPNKCLFRKRSPYST